MSPVNAMERSYSPIKEMLRRGVFKPGARLEANRLANELGVSMTPVRDVLHQLAGERLVEARIGNGFHVPRLSEGALRDLYEWNAALMTSATRSIDIEVLRAFESPDIPASDRFAAFVAHIAASTSNSEIGIALCNASDRLHPFRVVEAEIFADVDDELASLLIHGKENADAIRRFHVRRIRVSAELLRLRERPRI
ncbi:GntR family transcriptional regulator [Sphingomonas glacialis]|uniref:GntR family transcriptional regulator n=1 Tax=Sphingomonas glacialis TaxID=658225 RepID=A0A502FS76_9SPHN|nr:GntR family transcriptional regulator [Sphingomonas glacialis]TPG52230.1 GntR family transcriptional regulator [Sphingomonas glacialis]